jgi:hypothetical protein
MNNVEKLVKTLDMAITRQAEVSTSEMRIRGMSNIDSIVPAFGPCWMDFATVEIKRIDDKDCPIYTVTPEQFAGYLNAKRAFATR